jgi:hypothetical protein
MARKNTSRWIDDAEGPVLKVDLEGEDSPDPAKSVGLGGLQGAREAFLASSIPEQETGGFGGSEYDVASMPVVEGYDDDPGEEYDQDAHALEVARERWREVQASGGNQAADAGWDDPYNDPDEQSTQAEYQTWQQAPPGQGLDQFEFPEEDVSNMGDELEAQNIDPHFVMPSFLQRRFGITREQALALSDQFEAMFPGGEN